MAIAYFGLFLLMAGGLHVGLIGAGGLRGAWKLWRRDVPCGLGERWVDVPMRTRWSFGLEVALLECAGVALLVAVAGALVG